MCVPLSSYSTHLTILLLSFCLVIYLILEVLRLLGRGNKLLVPVVLVASRGYEREGIILGPITLACGIILVLIIFPLFPAQVGIIALTIGDGVSSLVGRLWGRIRPRCFFGKSLEGSLACMLGTFIILLCLPVYWPFALVLAFLTMVVEVLPLGCFDNIAIPLCLSSLTFFWGVLPYTLTHLMT